MGQQEPEPFGDRGGMRPNQKPVRRIGEIADQYAVEACPLVNARSFADDLGVERRSGRRDDLRGDPRRDPADHLYRHGDALLKWQSASLRGGGRLSSQLMDRVLNPTIGGWV